MAGSDHQLALAVAEGTADDAQRHRVDGSPRLRQLADRYRKVLDALASAAGHAPGPPPRLLRWASAYADTAAPSRRRSVLLGLLSSGTPAAAAVRSGTTTGVAELHGDDAHQVDLRLETGHDGGRATLRGQVVPLDGAGEGWTVAAVTADGGVHRTTADDAGVFELRDLPPTARLTVLLERDDRRLVVPAFGGRRPGEPRAP